MKRGIHVQHRSLQDDFEPTNHRTFALTSFAIYFGMYALRKPFAAGTWNHELWGVSLKVWLVSAQLMGYASAKWWGIRLVSQLKRNHQKFALWLMFGAAYASLLALAVVHDALRAFSIRSMVAFPATVENKELVSAVLRERSSNFLSTDFYL